MLFFFRLSEWRGFEFRSRNARPCGSAPIVDDLGLGRPFADGHQQAIGEGARVGLVHAAEMGKALVLFRAAFRKFGADEQVSQVLQLSGRQAFFVEIPRRRVQNLRQIDERVTRNRKRQFRLPLQRALTIGDQQRGDVEDGGQRGES